MSNGMEILLNETIVLQLPPEWCFIATEAEFGKRFRPQRRRRSYITHHLITNKHATEGYKLQLFKQANSKVKIM